MGNSDRNVGPELGKEIRNRPKAAQPVRVGWGDGEKRGVDLCSPQMAENNGVAQGKEKHPVVLFAQLRRHEECLDAACGVGEICLPVQETGRASWRERV